MNKFKITNSDGYERVIATANKVDEREIDLIASTLRKDAAAGLSSGWTRPARTRTGDKKAKAKQDAKEGYDSWLMRNTHDFLQVGKDKINLDREGSANERQKAGWLTNYESKAQWLIDKHGEDNVKGIEVNGKPNFLIRDNVSGEYYYFDSPKKTLTDVADVSGGILPATASVLAGGAAAITTKSPAATAAASSGAEFAVGSAQDAIARQLMGVDINPMQIAKSRAIDAALNFSVDAVTGGTGKFLFDKFIGAEGAGIAKTEMSKLAQEGIAIPTYARMGEKGLDRALKLEQAYPNSSLANKRNQTRQRISDNAESIMNGSPIDIQVETGRILSNHVKEVDRIRKELDQLKQSKTSSESKNREIELRSKAVNAQLQKALDLEVQKKAQSIGFGRKFAMEETGRSIMESSVKKRVLIEQEIGGQYDEAYNRLRDVSFSPEDVQGVYDKYGSEVSDGAKFSLDSLVADRAKKQIGSTSARMENADGLLDLRTLDEHIRDLSDLANFNGVERSTPQRRYGKLVGDLKDLRDQSIKNKDGSDLYAKATKRFQNEVVDYNESNIAKALKTKKSQSWSDVRKAVVSGESLKGVKFKGGGVEYFKEALKTPQTVKDFLSAAGGDLATRNEFKRAFLDSKGINPVEVKAAGTYKFKTKDYEIANAIDSTGMLSKQLKELSILSRNSDVKLSPTPKQVNDLIQARTEIESKLALDAIKASNKEKKLAELGNQKLAKLMANGEITPQTESVELISPLLSANFTTNDLKNFMGQIKTDEGKAGLERVTWEHFLNESKTGTAAAQFNKDTGQQLWDASEGSKFLSSNQKKLELIWGKDKFDKISILNDGMARFSKNSAIIEGEKASGGIVTMLIKLGRSQRDKLITAAYGKGGLFQFIPDRKFVSQSQYDEYWSKTLATLATSSTGIRSMMEEADRDPEFNGWLREQMAEFYSEVFQGQ